jgi:endoglucanase
MPTDKMRNPLRIFFVLAAILSFSAEAGGQSEFVTTRGQEIVGPGGTAILLQGVNLGNWLVPEGYMFAFDSATSPWMINEVMRELVGPEEAREFWRMFRDLYITQEDIRLIRRMGLNSVRVPFTWRLFLADEEPDLWLETGFEMLDRLVGWCTEESLGVILDMHCAPGGQTGDNIDDGWGYPFLFDSPAAQARTCALWRAIAKHYAESRTVIGYDLLNEPIPPFVDIERLNPLLEPLYRRIVAAIREVDLNHLVFLGGAQWNTNFQVFGPPFDEKVVYTFHRYWCDTTQEVLQEFLDFRERYGVPIWMGESGENTDRWIAGMRRLLERNNIGWCFWPYKKMDAPSCVVTFDRPKAWHILQEFAKAPRSGYASIRASRPPIEQTRMVFEEFLESLTFQKSRVNSAFVDALGCAAAGTATGK